MVEPSTSWRRSEVGPLVAVGQTPLVEIRMPTGIPSNVRLFAKLESSNPGGSLKDRSVKKMLGNALARGELRRGKRILDSSSGNAAIAYAQFGAALGLATTLVVPGNASRERLDRIRAHGAELLLTDPLEGYDHAIAVARKLATDYPERYWYCDQYSNPDNWGAHFESTGMEILVQVAEHTGTFPDAFVGGVGTGGSLTGIGRRLKKESDIHITAVIPEEFPGIEGLKPLGSKGDLVPAILDQRLIDRRRVVDSETALARSQWLARQGFFVGPSSGAYVEAALELAELGGFRSIVTLLNDTGERYGSTALWS